MIAPTGEAVPRPVPPPRALRPRRRSPPATSCAAPASTTSFRQGGDREAGADGLRRDVQDVHPARERAREDLDHRPEAARSRSRPTSSTPRSSPRSTRTASRIYPHGKFLKIVDKQRASSSPFPPCSTRTRLLHQRADDDAHVQVKYVEIEQLRGVLQQLVTPRATPSLQPDTIIITTSART